LSIAGNCYTKIEAIVSTDLYVVIFLTAGSFCSSNPIFQQPAKQIIHKSNHTQLYEIYDYDFVI
tara:strand:- start:6379 stop:6570 length:192 start_codon:yes stop_codon:yes gene_type:complete